IPAPYPASIWVDSASGNRPSPMRCRAPEWSSLSGSTGSAGMGALSSAFFAYPFCRPEYAVWGYLSQPPLCLELLANTTQVNALPAHAPDDCPRLFSRVPIPNAQALAAVVVPGATFGRILWVVEGVRIRTRTGLALRGRKDPHRLLAPPVGAGSHRILVDG